MKSLWFPLFSLKCIRLQLCLVWPANICGRNKRRKLNLVNLHYFLSWYSPSRQNWVLWAVQLPLEYLQLMVWVISSVLQLLISTSSKDRGTRFCHLPYFSWFMNMWVCVSWRNLIQRVGFYIGLAQFLWFNTVLVPSQKFRITQM